MVKSLRPLLFLLFLSLPLLSLPNGGGQVPELWKKAQAFFLKNRNRIPGIVVQKSSLRVGDRRTRREGEVWIRTFSGSPKGYRWEILKILQNGRDRTEALRKSEEKREGSRLFPFQDSPFNPEAKVFVQETGRSETLEGKSCRLFRFIQEGRALKDGKARPFRSLGMAWLDEKNGAPLKTESSLSPLPKKVRSMKSTTFYETAPRGVWHPRRMVVEGSGGFLFFKKSFRLDLSFSNYWRISSLS